MCDQRSIANLQTILYWNILASIISITREKVESTERVVRLDCGLSIRKVINKQTERGHCEQKQSENFAKLTPEMMISVSELVMVTVNKRPGHLSPHYSIDCNPGPHLLG